MDLDNQNRAKCVLSMLYSAVVCHKCTRFRLWREEDSLFHAHTELKFRMDG
jgi:hypothetical protein